MIIFVDVKSLQSVQYPPSGGGDDLSLLHDFVGSWQITLGNQGDRQLESDNHGDLTHFANLCLEYRDVWGVRLHSGGRPQKSKKSDEAWKLLTVPHRGHASGILMLQR